VEGKDVGVVREIAFKAVRLDIGLIHHIEPVVIAQQIELVVVGVV